MSKERDAEAVRIARRHFESETGVLASGGGMDGDEVGTFTLEQLEAVALEAAELRPDVVVEQHAPRRFPEIRAALAGPAPVSSSRLRAWVDMLLDVTESDRAALLAVNELMRKRGVIMHPIAGMEPTGDPVEEAAASEHAMASASVRLKDAEDRLAAIANDSTWSIEDRSRAEDALDVLRGRMVARRPDSRGADFPGDTTPEVGAQL